MRSKQRKIIFCTPYLMAGTLVDITGSLAKVFTLAGQSNMEGSV
jgi:hypothetical protein